MRRQLERHGADGAVRVSGSGLLESPIHVDSPVVLDSNGDQSDPITNC